ncbi:hypothetical protein AQUCO_01700223v1 [Aquilegia coerulea]|uniref:Homeobox domain-containing protein n=1 Tax=Aquilegia coerulea TaxID=218851 RepID=A0A2G5DLU1_AQUCA|nr:hypothetical protein AQUCO_01700223v1 [Aquilegia coerulea]
MKKNSKEKPFITLTEINVGNSLDSFTKFLDSQKDLFHSQVDQLQNIVVTQCRLTGANPLSQEMAAGALSINIGKRPRDLLNPKGVKYMQSVFAIKDTISKKETREISALCGVTATQVREFFASQRSRVRKLVRLSREKAIKSDAERMLDGGCSTSSDSAMHVIDPTPLNVVDPNAIKSDAGKTLEGLCSTNESAMHVINPTPLNSMDPKAVGEAPSCSSKEETVPGADDFEKKFIENIFSSMRKEETFSGQVKLMEWILQVQNSSVLYWFVTKGGLMILAAWLNEAALEEQTTTLFVIFQVLCHLPLHKALPVQMSAILQAVNRLRFYRTSDISNRAKVLLSRWSKLFVRSQALKKPSSSFSATQKGKNLRQSEALSDDWQATLDLPEDILSLALDGSEYCRKSEPSPSLKLLEASNDDSNKKHVRNVSSTQTKERRKVQLMEQPGRNTNGRSPQVTRAMNSNQGRPMSADDIQKAKLRAAFMQSKYGKTATASNESRQQKAEDQKKAATQNSQLPSPSKAPVKQVTEESERPVVLPSVTSPKPPGPSVDFLPGPSVDSLPEPSVNSLPEPSVNSLPEPSMDSKLSINFPPEPSMISMPSLTAEESPWEKLKRNQISWRLPTEIMNSEWKVRVGENSKEVEIQTRRIKREKETIYQRNQDIPSNPKEPWDLEMDYDDTLTPQIPTEQAPEEFSIEQAPEPEVLHAPLRQGNVETTSLTPVTTETSISASDNAAEPDLELLAVLLKNPELVFALTSGQGGNISSADTVKLLDLIKNTGGGLTGVLNGLKGPTEEEPVSFPSPTPYSLPSPTPTSLPSPTPSEHNGWRSDVRNNSFQQPVPVSNREAYVLSQTAPSVPSPIRISATGLVQYQSQTTNFTPGYAQVQSQTTQEYQSLPANNQENIHWGLNRHSIPVSSHQDRQLPQMNQNSNPTPSAYNLPQQHTLAAAYSRLQPESTSFGQISLQSETVNYGQMQSLKPAPVSVMLNLPDGTPLTLPPLMPTQPPQQSSLLPEQSFLQPMHGSMQWNGTTTSRQNQVGNNRGGRQMSYDTSDSNPWSQSNQNNYNSYPGEPPMRLPVSDNFTWDRNEYQDEPHFETYSPDRLERSRSPEYHSGRDYSEPRRDRGRNPRPDWSRRRDSGRHDNKQGNRWRRDRRF